MEINKLLKIKEIIDKYAHDKISVKLGYKFMKFCKSIEIEEAFFNERMVEIVSAYCKKDGHGTYIRTETGGIEIIEDKIDECNKALEELNSLEVKKPDFVFTLDELEELKLSISDLAILDDFIVE